MRRIVRSHDPSNARDLRELCAQLCCQVGKREIPSLYRQATIGVVLCLSQQIDVVMTREEPVVTQPIAHVERDQQRCGESQRKPKEIDCCIDPIAKQVTECGCEIISHHDRLKPPWCPLSVRPACSPLCGHALRVPPSESP